MMNIDLVLYVFEEQSLRKSWLVECNLGLKICLKEPNKVACWTLFH